LLGYLTIVLVLSLGDTGKTHFVVAGLIIYAVPIIDTVLAIVRRKLAGKSMSEADDQHLHHMLKRSLGVKGAALTLYAIAAVFATLGVVLTEGRVRIVFTFALVLGAFIGVTAVKIARRAAIEADAARHHVAPPAADATRAAAVVSDKDRPRTPREAVPTAAEPIGNA
jgi:UDP-GlcNAc:undecaprenyl-phosphate GlcNAc-1-phosphate transferase